MNKLRVLELFGGIGACSKALERLDIDYEIADYVEIDKYAVMSFNAIHNTNFEPQDICNWNKDIEVDLIMHGSPCQDFSLAGKQAGGDEGSGTRSSLMYETLRIVEKLKPKYVIWENVKNVISKKHIHNFNNYINKMSELGYISYYQVLNSKDYGIPQNRERVFTISIRNDLNQVFEFPQKQELKLRLKDILEDEVEDKYRVKKANNIVKTKNYLQWSNSGKMQNSQAERAYFEDGLCPTLSSCNSNGDKSQIITRYKEYTNFYTIPRGTDGKLINGSYNRVWKKEKYVGSLNLTKITEIGELNKMGLIIRKLTPKECWRLMGFDDEDFEKASKVNSNTQLYKQAGNSIVVNVLEGILRNLLLDEKAKGTQVQTTIFDFIKEVNMEETIINERKTFNNIINNLHKKLNAKDKIINEQALEISQLKERFERLVQEHIDTITRNEEKQQRIDKAIEYMKKYNEIVVPDANIKSLILKEEYKKIIEILGDKQ